MQVYKSLERSPSLLGLPIFDFGLVICLLLAVVMIGGIANMVIHVSGWYYLIGLLLITGCYVVLRRAAKENRPNFLLSWISFHFYQPKSIDMSHDDTVFEK